MHENRLQTRRRAEQGVQRSLLCLEGLETIKHCKSCHLEASESPRMRGLRDQSAPLGPTLWQELAIGHGPLVTVGSQKVTQLHTRSGLLESTDVQLLLEEN